MANLIKPLKETAPETITFCIHDKEILEFDATGCTIYGRRIEDAGEIYEALIAFLRRIEDRDVIH